MNTAGERESRASFGSDAAAYDAGRPGYPHRVAELLREWCRLGPDSRVLEVGAGSGQATRMLLDSGASVQAVELSPDLAGLLTAKHPSPRLDVRVGAFEELQFEPGSFDLVASATAFHWVPTTAGLEQCATALTAGGHVALWWNVYGDPGRADPFHDALTDRLQQLEPALIQAPSAGHVSAAVLPYALDTAARTDDLTASGAFEQVRCELIRWTGTHTASELRALFATFSPWLALPEPRRRAALDVVEQIAQEQFEGAVSRPYVTAFYTARRT